MSNPSHRALLHNLLLASGARVVHLIGTGGLLLIDAARGGHASGFDAFYMTFITVATIGCAQTIDLAGSTWGRAFNVGIVWPASARCG